VTDTGPCGQVCQFREAPIGSECKAMESIACAVSSIRRFVTLVQIVCFDLLAVSIGQCPFTQALGHKANVKWRGCTVAECVEWRSCHTEAVCINYNRIITCNWEFIVWKECNKAAEWSGPCLSQCTRLLAPASRLHWADK